MIQNGSDGSCKCCNAFSSDQADGQQTNIAIKYV